MRIDLLMCRLRFAKTRAAAQTRIAAGHIRVNAARVVKPAYRIQAGDVLTIPQAGGILVARIDRLPERRGPPAEARLHYHALDPALDRTPAPAVAAGATLTPEDHRAL